jgi:hypothetical protein
MSDNNPQSFNPREHLRQIKSRDGYQEYLDVKWRLVWFREQCPNGTIDTEEVMVDLDREVEEEAFVWNAEKRRSEKIVKHGRGYARFRAVVTDGKGGRATGTKSENAASFPDFIEKAETGAIGRALAALGYGTQFAPEMDEAHRIVDSPVERNLGVTGATPTGNGNGNGNGNGSRGNTNPNANTGNGGRATGSQPSAGDTGNGDSPSSITEQQIASIRKLSEHLNKIVPPGITDLSFVDGRKLIQQLTAEYREAKQRKAS